MPVISQFKLNNKIAVIAGNGQDWGPSIAEALIEAGAIVAIIGAEQNYLNLINTKSDNLTKSISINADLRNIKSVEAAADQIEGKLGPIDILVNNPQVQFGKPFMETSPVEWNTIFSQNITSILNCSQIFGKQMLKLNQGRIINITSILAVRGLSNSVLYCASQGAVYQITQSLGIEWARTNIRVNGIGAGWLNTTKLSPEEQSSNKLSRFIPSRRQGHPEDICGLLIYLSSDYCEFVTGQTIFIDGGALAHP